MSSIIVVSPAAVRAIEPEELSEYLKLPDIPDEDARLVRFCDAAIAQVESQLMRAGITRTLREVWREREPYYWREVRLAFAPVLPDTVSEILIDDEILDPEDWEIANGDDGLIEIPDGHRGGSKFEVAYSAGYGAAPADIPEAMRMEMLRTAASLYNNPEKVITGTISSELPVTSPAYYLRRWFL